MTCPAPLAAIAVLSALLCGCSGSGLEEGKVVGVVKANPFNLESEEVTLNIFQVNCGVENDLWEAPVEVPDRMVARLTQKGRDLNFTDDISIGEQGYSEPHAQMRGKVSLDVSQVLSIADGKEQGTKIVQAQLRVVVPHPCFPAPLPIMGIRRGRPQQGLAPTMEFDLTDHGWRMDHFIH